jgi:uncharacterized membrane protein YedE/YeeE
VKRYAVQLAFGILFGFVFSRGGFSDWREVYGMFTLKVWDPAIAFATVLAITAPLWLWLKRRAARPVVRPVHPGSIPGGIVFGVGWALSGACPALALTQLGEGKGMALVTLVGIVIGNWGYAVVHERHFRWQSASCAED